MNKYAKVTDVAQGLVSVGTGTNTGFYQSIGMELMDVEQGYDGRWYLMGYAPTITTDELAERVRTERDARIAACDWVIIRHRDEVDEGEGTTLTAEEYAAWLSYRKALRDLPLQDGFPWSGGDADDAECPWPTEPVS